MQNSLKDLIAARGSFLLTGHENPDGDCLGAEVALFHLLRALGKDVAIVNPDPLGRGFDFLLRHTPFGHYSPDAPLPPFEVAVLLDCCQLSRVGGLAGPLRKSGAVLAVIDHHVGSDAGDGQVNFVDPTAAATGALVRRLYREFDQPLSPAAAEGVFLSLVMDTGWFRYSNTDHEVLSMAAELVATGVQPSVLYDQLYRRMHPEAAALLATCLQRSELRLSGKLALVALDRSLVERAAHLGFDTDLVIDPLRSLEGVEVVALLKERFDGVVKLSLRAKGDVDVQRIAGTFGGGGHKKAAGAALPGPLPEASARLEARVQQALAEVATQERG
ncbi:MAG: bifunctional oligoribonuclease/PAP phosphatase NrnA [Planctomycetota bacterium]